MANRCPDPIARGDWSKGAWSRGDWMAMEDEALTLHDYDSWANALILDIDLIKCLRERG